MENELQYFMLYFPKNQIVLKEECYLIMANIDFNFSKLVQQLLPQIKEICTQISQNEENWRDYTWQLQAVRKDLFDEEDSKSTAENSEENQ